MKLYNYNANYIMIFFLVILSLSTFRTQNVYAKPTPEDVKKEIIKQAELYNVNAQNALKIAKCESRFDTEAKNPKGTAKGVFQFTDPTWRHIKAPGHQYDYKENIKQFMIWYPKKPQWWQCKK